MAWHKRALSEKKRGRYFYHLKYNKMNKIGNKKKKKNSLKI